MRPPSVVALAHGARRAGLGRVLVAAAALTTLPPLVVLAHELDEHGTIQWEVDSAASTSEATSYVRVRLKAPAIAVPGRQPLNLALVLDRSGSMDDDSKIGYVRQAAHLVADNLTPDDHVVFIAYNEEVHALVPLHRAVNRDYLHHRIDELHADGYTNLSGGFLEGCAQLQTRAKEPGRHHLILLTDGLANRGVTDPEKLARLVARCSEGGITVTAIGVGTDYNEKLLRRMAQAGGGRYVYVAKPDQIPAAFQEELGALLAVVAQNVTVAVEVPQGVEVDRVYGWDEPPSPGRLKIPLGDLTSGEERVLLVKLRAKAGASSRPMESRVALTYDDVAEARRVTSERTAPIDGARPVGSGGAGATGPVLAYARLVEALDKIALAVRSMDRRQAAEVFQIRKQDYPPLKQAAVASDDQDFVNKAFLFEHFAKELEELVHEGALHEHSEARARLQKELDYRRYLAEHHRSPH